MAKEQSPKRGVTQPSDQTIDGGKPLAHKSTLELELSRLRNQALAARLEARAAELELARRRRQAADDSPGPVSQRHQPPANRSLVAGHSTPGSPAPIGPVESQHDAIAAGFDWPVRRTRGEGLAAEPGINRVEADAGLGTLRRRPIALSVTTVVHVLLLMLLALIGISTRSPRDEVELSASAAEVDQVSIETVPNDPQVVTDSAVDAEASEVTLDWQAEFELGKPPSDRPSNGPRAAIDGTLRGQADHLLKSVNAKPTGSAEFCGVSGGGNHFVYLVDCSKSMRAGFDSARDALINSIGSLKPAQRFYVIFFDEELSKAHMTEKPNPAGLT